MSGEQKHNRIIREYFASDEGKSLLQGKIEISDAVKLKSILLQSAELSPLAEKFIDRSSGSKRKDNGMFFTPYPVALSMVQAAFELWLINPADDIEAKAAVKAAYEHVGPVYLRFGRLAVPVINDHPDYKFEIGKGIVLKEGTDVSIFATGLEVCEAIEAAKMLEADGINAEVINIHTIKPLDEELVIASATKTGKVVTVEEHSTIGGLGSAVCEVLAEKAPTKVLRIGHYRKHHFCRIRWL